MSKIVLSFFIIISYVYGQNDNSAVKKEFRLDSVEGLELINVKAETVKHKDKVGLQITKADGEIKGETLLIIPGINFKNGTITVELTGELAPDADPQMRGFVGVAFRINPNDNSKYECIYFRPTNARSDNQLRRNHSVQYISHPEYPWYVMRKESPELYESYVDMVPGEWTKVKIEVVDQKAKLYVHDAEQPCLIVNDLKKGTSEGKIALWLHSSTLARYRNLVVTSK
jgi:3-keto-disaccharide hydrolase